MTDIEHTPDYEYIDVRFVLRREVDEDLEESFVRVDRVERLALSDTVTEDDTRTLAESFAQTDRLRMLASEIGNVLDGDTIRPRR
jgi:hypothetical protein